MAILVMEIKVQIKKLDNSQISTGRDLAEAKQMIKLQDPKECQYTWKTFCMTFCEQGPRQADN